MVFNALKRAFSKKKGSEKEDLSGLGAEELLERAKRRREALEKTFTGECAQTAKETEQKRLAILELLSSLEKTGPESAENVHGVIKKVSDTSRGEFITKARALLEKNSPKKKEPGQLYWFALDAHKKFGGEIIGLRKQITYTGFVAKSEMKEIGRQLQEFETALLELNQKARETGFGKAMEAEEDAISLLEKEKAISEKERKAGEIEEEKKALEREKEGTEKRLAEHTQSEEFKSHKSLLDRKKKLEEEKARAGQKALDAITSINKPLTRLSAIAESEKFPMEKNEVEMLKKYLENPLGALKHDPKAENLKKILEEAETAIAENAIAFKDEKEKQKKLSAIREAKKFDYFGEIFWKTNEIDREKAVVEQKISESTAIRRKQELEKEKERAEARIRETEEARKRTLEALEREKKEFKEKKKALAEKNAGP